MNPTLHIEKLVYGGDALARDHTGAVKLIPFALPGETVAPSPIGPEILIPSPARVAPRCIHFGTCGGCQYQMASYPEQLAIKQAILQETLDRAGLTNLPPIHTIPSPDPWGYRNRIRLRIQAHDGAVQLGYNLRNSNTFLPITMCPIAAPVLWRTAQALLHAASLSQPSAAWLAAAAELEVSCAPDESAVQLHLLCPGKPALAPRRFHELMEATRAAGVPLVSSGASRLHTPSGRPAEELATWGKDGLAYPVGDHTFWLKRGSFFQVNRFLIPHMVDLVCAGQQGALAWDLFAGVGLFARQLASTFAAVTAVEASPLAQPELQRGLPRPPASSQDRAIQQTTLAFLRQAVLQRERPNLVVLDPPRAGAGAEACALLARLAPERIVYVSCDPTTLARDLVTLLESGYRVANLHMIDLFPQTFHLETVMVLYRDPVPR